MFGRTFLLGSFLLFLVFLDFANATTFEEDTRLTKREAATLRKFKEKVKHKLKHDYQKEDLFLLRHLRAYKFDIPKAEEFLMKNVRWREQMKMETIHEEDWSDMEKEYTMEFSGHDRFGRPILLWDLGDWDVRRAVLAGKTDRLLRWLMKNWDMAREKVRELELQNKNITRYTLLVDVKNINAATNVNPASMPFYVTLAINFDSYFPSWCDNSWGINAPSIFDVVLSLVRGVVSKETNERLKVYGKNAEEWKPILFELVDPKELPKRYGGTREDSH